MAIRPTRRVERLDGVWRVFVKPPAFMRLPEQHVDLTSDQFERFCKWQNGDGAIQTMLHDLTASQREILISGLGDDDFARITADK